MLRAELGLGVAIIRILMLGLVTVVGLLVVPIFTISSVNLRYGLTRT